MIELVLVGVLCILLLVWARRAGPKPAPDVHPAGSAPVDPAFLAAVSEAGSEDSVVRAALGAEAPPPPLTGQEAFDTLPAQLRPRLPLATCPGQFPGGSLKPPARRGTVVKPLVEAPVVDVAAEIRALKDRGESGEVRGAGSAHDDGGGYDADGFLGRALGV